LLPVDEILLDEDLAPSEFQEEIPRLNIEMVAE
jgi:hypothetical protein